MITFEGIRQIYEEEKRQSTILIKLPDNFFTEIKVYIKNKQRAISEGESPDELETAKRRLESVFEIRERKIINAALDYVRTDVEPQNLLEDEERLFRIIVENIVQFRDDMAKKLAPGEKTEEKSESKPEESEEKCTENPGIIGKPLPETKKEEIKEEATSNESEMYLVDFKDDMHEFMGIDLKTYGPFKKGDIATVPKENAKVIERIGKGTLIKPSESQDAG